MPTKSIDTAHMEKDPEYFGEAFALYNQFDIKIMQFNYYFDSELVVQFFATVHFGKDEERSLTWMIHGKVLHAKWKEFMKMLGYGDDGPHNTLGLCLHRSATATHKSELYKYMCIRKTTRTEIRELIPFLDIMHHIFRQTLFPHIGD